MYSVLESLMMINGSFFPFSMLLSCSCFSLFYGCFCGLVPGGAELNGVAPSSGEQPIPSAPRYRPFWPSRSMMILDYLETFFFPFLRSSLKANGCLLANRCSECRYISIQFKYVSVLLVSVLQVCLISVV